MDLRCLSQGGLSQGDCPLGTRAAETVPLARRTGGTVPLAHFKNPIYSSNKLNNISPEQTGRSAVVSGRGAHW